MSKKNCAKIMLIVFVCSIQCLFAAAGHADEKVANFTEADIRFLKQFTLSALPDLPKSPGNQYANSTAAARLGHKIFFDTGFSQNGKIACATCHVPQQYFTDGSKTARGIGLTNRNTPSLLVAAYGPWSYWDGRKDSLWAQALEPLEAPKEHGFSRDEVYDRITKQYREEYEALFGLIPAPTTGDKTQVFVNVGKALMAYQRHLKLLPSRFDLYVMSLSEKNNTEKPIAFTPSEVNGLKLFMGKAACASCHNGPLFTNFEFHNVGVPEANIERVDLGRYAGIEKLRADEFTCLSKWSDANQGECEEMAYLKMQGPELVGAFKTPSLRNVDFTAPYMHSGQFRTLNAVVQHYNSPTPPYFDPQQHPNRPHFDILPLQLTDEEQNDLIQFLRTLTSPIPNDDPWWENPLDPA